MDKVIVVDVGNTSTSLAWYEGGRVRGVCRLPGAAGGRGAVEEAVSAMTRARGADAAVLASVVPASVPAWRGALRRAVGRAPLIVTHRVRLGVRVDYPKPATIGADRLANACAAYDLFGAPVIVADFGTAVTFDIVAAGGTYIGGVIAPGLPLMTDYLHERTALLPDIGLKGPCPRVGRSTEGAMRIGAKIGYRGMVREIVSYVQESMGGGVAALCATGGFARWALAGCDLPFEFRPELTLYGLGRIHELNQTGV